MQGPNFYNFVRNFANFSDNILVIYEQILKGKLSLKHNSNALVDYGVKYLACKEYLLESKEYIPNNIVKLINDIEDKLFGVIYKKKSIISASELKSDLFYLSVNINTNVDISFKPDEVTDVRAIYGAATVKFYSEALSCGESERLSTARKYYRLFLENFNYPHPIVRDAKGQILVTSSVLGELVKPMHITSGIYKRDMVYEQVPRHPGFSCVTTTSEEQFVPQPYKQDIKKQKVKKVKKKVTKDSIEKSDFVGVILMILSLPLIAFGFLFKGLKFLGKYLLQGLKWLGVILYVIFVKPFQKLGGALKNIGANGGGGSLLACFICLLCVGVSLLLEFTGLIYKMAFDTGDLMLTEFYHFNLVNLFVGWLSSTEHVFLSAIALGLLQIILIALGAVIDVLIYVVLFAVSIAIMIVGIAVQLGYFFVLPIGACLISIVKCLKSGFNFVSVLMILLSITGTVIYFINFIPALGI